jgi:NAD(P)-dependent dehydrogenase (short-subunit alcohol dehydrogenase family)
MKEHLNPYSSLSAKISGKIAAGKSAIVTGGGYGLGAAIAKSFAEAGVTEIILAGRTESKLKATAGDLASFKGIKVSYHAVDISSKDDVKRFFDSLTTAPDFLVNNAGFLATPANFIEADLDDYWESFTTNVFGTALFTQAYLRHHEAHKSSTTPPAVVVTLNTIGAYSVRVPGLSSYGASKAALARWSELVSVDVPETTARFISVHPGALKTEMGAKSGLDGAFPSTDVKLAADFVVWTTSDEAQFLAGRFVWVNWDVDELLAAKDEVISKDSFRTSLSE